MASKINGLDFDAPITPYTFEGNDYNTLRVHVDYDNNGYWKGGAFYVSLTPEKIERSSGGFATRCFRITGTRDPLGSWIRITIEEAPRNSQKRICKIFENLTNPTRKEQIAWLFDQRRWETLQAYVKEVALTGVFSGEINYSEAPAAEAQEQGATNQESSTPNNNETTMGTKNINTMAAAEFVGKTIIVGEGIATIIIKSASGDVLQGEFQKEGVPSMAMPIPLEQLRKQVENGAWSIEGVEKPSETVTEDVDVEEVEDIDLEEEPTADEQPTAEEPIADETEQPTAAEEDDPVLQQWREAKKKSPNAIILMRSGDVYVTLMEDAEKVNGVAGIAMRVEGNVTMGVFAASELDTILPQVIQAGHRVNIVDLSQPQKTTAKRGETEEQPKPAVEQPTAGQPKDAKPKVAPRRAKAEPDAESEQPAADEQPATEDSVPSGSPARDEQPAAEQSKAAPKKPKAEPTSEQPTTAAKEPLHIEVYSERACILLGTTTHAQRVILKGLANYQTLKQGEYAGQGAWVFPTKRRAKVEKALNLGGQNAEHTESVTQDNGVPHIVKYSEKGIIVAGDTRLIEPVLESLGGQRRAFLRGGKAYSGIVLHARHKETVRRILDLAYTA